MAMVSTLEDKLAAAAKSQDMWYYLSKQRHKTPVGNFVEAHPFLKNLKIKKPKKNFLKYEIVSPELRAVIKALEAAKISADAAGVSNRRSDRFVSIAGKKGGLQVASLNCQAQLATADAKKAYKNLLAAVIELLPKLTSEELVLESDIPSIPRNQVEIVDFQLSRTDRIIKGTLNENMLVAALKEDRRAFNKAFKAFEAFACEHEPHKYAPGLSDANSLYTLLCGDSLVLQDKDKKLFLDLKEDNSRSILDIGYYLKISIEKFEEHLIAQNKLDPSKNYINEYDDESDIAPEDLKKIEALIANAARVRKYQLEKSILNKKSEVKILQQSYNKEFLQEAKIKHHRIRYIWIWCWSFLFNFKASDKSSSKVGKKVYKAETVLESKEKDLQSIKAAQGYIYGFYYTPGLDNILRAMKGGDKRKSNLGIAIRAKIPVETLMQRVIIIPTKNAWKSICYGIEFYALLAWCHAVEVYAYLKEKLAGAKNIFVSTDHREQPLQSSSCNTGAPNIHRSVHNGANNTIESEKSSWWSWIW